MYCGVASASRKRTRKPARADRLGRKGAHVGERGQRQRRVVVLDARAEKTPATVNTRSRGSGGASALAIGTSSVIASPTVDAELIGQRLADDQSVAALAQCAERAGDQERCEIA